MTDPRSFNPPAITTFTNSDGTTSTRRETWAKHPRGKNAHLRKIHNPLLRVMCRTVTREPDGSETVRAVLFGVVREDSSGLSLLTPGEPRPVVLHLDYVADMEKWPGTCPCGRMHTIDLGRLREAVSRLRVLNNKARTVDITRVSA